jgi:tRNA U34 2-thiouridine synthase MnmA/TrmU
MVLDQKKVRALGLCSGGLDSILSALVLREQGIDVAWVSFETPFFSADKARKAAKMTGVPLTVRDITPTYLRMLKNPPCGYGQNMNPCLDCHALMFRLAGEMMTAERFDFLFSGEVMGQRPMSQTRHSLRYVEKNSGFEGYIVRPLSIQRLPETIPEKNGWIRREDLYGIAGRSRKPQIALARRFNITDYPNPAGGCLLTDKHYCTRLKDLFDQPEPYGEDDLHLLRHGRHFRLTPAAKVIVGRDRKDNEAILRHYDRRRHTLIKTPRVPGPVVLVSGAPTAEDRLTAAAICVGYSRVPGDAPAEVNIIHPEGTETLRRKGVPPAAVNRFLI